MRADHNYSASNVFSIPFASPEHPQNTHIIVVIEMSTDTRRRVSCLRFSGLPPPPSAPCADPTPDELFELVMAEQRQMSEARREAEAAKAGQGGSGAAGAAAAEQGAFATLARFASKAVNAVDGFANSTHEATERKLRALERERGQSAFAANFGALPGENFVVSYSCGIMSAGSLVSGALVITDRRVCFSSDTLRDSLLWTQVATLQRAVALPTHNVGPPFFIPIPSPVVVSNTLQIFTTDARIWQLLDFDTAAAKAGAALATAVMGTACERCYNWADHAWRKMTPVPLPGVSYAAF